METVHELKSITDRETLELASLIFDIEKKLRALGMLQRAKPSTVASVFKSAESGRSPFAIAELKRLQSELTSACEVSKATSIAQLQKFIGVEKLELRDVEIFETIDDEDVIEVFDDRGIQIWRNWRYFEVCPYSPCELFTEDWHSLYLRPASIAAKLLKMMPGMFQPTSKLVEYELPEYLIAARKYPDAACFLFKMKFAAPLFNTEGRVTAFVSTGRIKLLENAKRGAVLDFI